MLRARALFLPSAAFAHHVRGLVSSPARTQMRIRVVAAVYGDAVEAETGGLHAALVWELDVMLTLRNPVVGLAKHHSAR
jgi:hypothetical protein